MAKVVLSPNLVSAIHSVWSHIGSDLESCCQEAGERLTNEGALESCIDADRMTALIKNPAADAEISALIKEHTYPVLMRTLKKEIKLV